MPFILTSSKIIINFYFWITFKLFISLKVGEGLDPGISSQSLKKGDNSFNIFVFFVLVLFTLTKTALVLL